MVCLGHLLYEVGDGRHIEATIDTGLKKIREVGVLLLLVKLAGEDGELRTDISCHAHTLW